MRSLHIRRRQPDLIPATQLAGPSAVVYTSIGRDEDDDRMSTDERRVAVERAMFDGITKAESARTFQQVGRFRVRRARHRKGSAIVGILLWLATLAVAFASGAALVWLALR